MDMCLDIDVYAYVCICICVGVSVAASEGDPVRSAMPAREKVRAGLLLRSEGPKELLSHEVEQGLKMV